MCSPNNPTGNALPIDDMLRTGAVNGRKQFQSPLAASIMGMGESDD